MISKNISLHLQKMLFQVPVTLSEAAGVCAEGRGEGYTGAVRNPRIWVGPSRQDTSENLCRNPHFQVAVHVFRGVPVGAQLFRIALSTPKAQTSLLLLHHDQVSNCTPPLSLSFLGASSHWPYTEQSHTNIGLACRRCLFPGFLSTSLTSILCPAVILPNPAWIMSLSAQKLPGAPTAAQIKFSRSSSGLKTPANHPVSQSTPLLMDIRAVTSSPLWPFLCASLVHVCMCFSKDIPSCGHHPGKETWVLAAWSSGGRGKQGKLASGRCPGSPWLHCQRTVGSGRNPGPAVRT